MLTTYFQPGFVQLFLNFVIQEAHSISLDNALQTEIKATSSNKIILQRPMIY